MATPAPATITTARPDIQTSDPEHELEDGPVAHIVKVGPGETATAKVLDARINGTPLEALCGHIWVPSRDPRQLPMCEPCKEVYGLYREFNDGLNETPGD